MLDARELLNQNVRNWSDQMTRQYASPLDAIVPACKKVMGFPLQRRLEKGP